MLLGDIQVPIQHFEEKGDLSNKLAAMFAGLGRNIEHIDGPDDDRANERSERLAAAWDRYTVIQKGKEPATAAAIKATSAAAEELSAALIERCLGQWAVWNDESPHGTALFVLNANHELAVWVNPEVSEQDPEAKAIKDSLRETLIGFVDPYLESPP